MLGNGRVYFIFAYTDNYNRGFWCVFCLKYLPELLTCRFKMTAVEERVLRGGRSGDLGGQGALAEGVLPCKGQVQELLDLLSVSWPELMKRDRSLLPSLLACPTPSMWKYHLNTT